MLLRNKYDKETLFKKLQTENFERKTLSFYRYCTIHNPNELRDELYEEWGNLNVLGRIYLAKEGINAQLNVPKPNLEQFINTLEAREIFKSMPFKWAVEEKESFLKLKIKVRNKIVADGLNDNTFDITNVGNHLTAEEFNEAMNSDDTIVVDMRNHYESEIGHFENALLPKVETFKEELPVVKNLLEDKKDKKILLYCTGGIRCEKASAYLKHNGFEDVNQLYGGIIEYHKQVKEKELPNKFVGKNFVFDDRLAERISDDVIAVCHQCGNPSDDHTNCANVGCNLLFIQCSSCKTDYKNTCTPRCKAIIELPEEVQKERRKGSKVKKRFNKGLEHPEALRALIAEQQKNGFNL